MPRGDQKVATSKAIYCTPSVASAVLERNTLPVPRRPSWAVLISEKQTATCGANLLLLEDFAIGASTRQKK